MKRIKSFIAAIAILCALCFTTSAQEFAPPQPSSVTTSVMGNQFPTWITILYTKTAGTWVQRVPALSVPLRFVTAPAWPADAKLWAAGGSIAAAAATTQTIGLLPVPGTLTVGPVWPAYQNVYLHMAQVREMAQCVAPSGVVNLTSLVYLASGNPTFTFDLTHPMTGGFADLNYSQFITISNPFFMAVGTSPPSGILSDGFRIVIDSGVDNVNTISDGCAFAVSLLLSRW